MRPITNATMKGEESKREREKKEEDIRRHTVGGPDVLKLSQREKRGKIFRVFFQLEREKKVSSWHEPSNIFS